VLTTERKGQISYELLKAKVKRSDGSLREIRREIGNISNETGIDQNELRQFFREIFTEAMEEALTPKNKVESSDS